jgi:hypothetical protein
MEGIVYSGVFAKSKSAANAFTRRQAQLDGHLAGGKGRVFFTAIRED